MMLKVGLEEKWDGERELLQSGLRNTIALR